MPTVDRGQGRTICFRQRPLRSANASADFDSERMASTPISRSAAASSAAKRGPAPKRPHCQTKTLGFEGVNTLVLRTQATSKTWAKLQAIYLGQSSALKTDGAVLCCPRRFNIHRAGCSIDEIRLSCPHLIVGGSGLHAPPSQSEASLCTGRNEGSPGCPLLPDIMPGAQFDVSRRHRTPASRHTDAEDGAL